MQPVSLAATRRISPPVQRLDGVHINDPDRDPFLLQDLGSLQRALDHHAHGHHRNVGAVPQKDALADLKVIALQGIGDGLHRQTAQAKVGGTVVVHQSLHSGGHLVAVAGAQYRHAGDGPHDGKVLDALVGRAVLAD